MNCCGTYSCRWCRRKKTSILNNKEMTTDFIDKKIHIESDLHDSMKMVVIVN